MREPSSRTARSTPAAAPTTSTLRAVRRFPRAGSRRTPAPAVVASRPGISATTADAGSMAGSVKVQSTASTPMSSSQSPDAVSAPGGRPGARSAYRPRTARTHDQASAAAAAPARARGSPSVRSTSQPGTPRPSRSKQTTSGRYRPGPPFGPGRAERSRCTVGPCGSRSNSWLRGRFEAVRGSGAPASPTGPDIPVSGSSTCPMNPPVTVASPQTGRIRRSWGLTDAPSLGARYPHTCHFAGVPVKFRHAV